MSLRPAALILHASAAAIMMYGWCGLRSLSHVDDWISSQKGGHYQFLTIQALGVSFITMVLSLICDLFPGVQSIRNAKRASLMLSLPLSIVVSTIYWTLLLLLPSLILQAESPETTPPSSSPAAPNLLRIPLSMDLSLHASPVVTLLLDFFLFEHKYPQWQARYWTPSLCIIFTVWYVCWVEYCASFNGHFPYPFLTNNPFNIRVGIYACACSLAWGCFHAINALHPRGALKS